MSKVKSCRLLAGLISLLLGLAMSLFAQEMPLTGSPEDLRQQGSVLLAKAEQSATREEQIRDLNLALEKFRAAVQVRPDYYLANALMAQTLFGLVRQLEDPSQRVRLAIEARDRFSLAAKLPDADWRIYNAEGRFLTYCAMNLNHTTGERTADLENARKLFESALTMTKLRSETAQVDVTYAECLFRLAETVAETNQRRTLLEDCVARFDHVFKAAPYIMDANGNHLWGEALLELGKLNSDAELLRRAVERLQSSLEEKPGSLEARFNLVRAYALLKQKDDALRELRACSETDSAGTSALVGSEHDLASLRGSAEFEKIISKKTTDVPSQSSPESLFEAGQKLQRNAENAELPGESTAFYEQAIKQYQKATEGKTDYYAAQLMWANCLARLSLTSPNPKQQQSLAEAARERYVTASRCRAADWKVYYNWGVLLTGRVNALAKGAADASALLKEARTLFEKSLRLASYSGDKALVERDSAVCLIAIAERSAEPRERRTLYQKAVSLFQTASEKSPKTMTARYYGLWGVSALQVAKLSNDSMLIRQATERLLTALEMDPNNSEARYNLVCAYALLDQPDNAMRHLRICLTNDPQKVYYNAAANDPDFYNLRRTREYNDLFPPQRALDSLSIEPRINNR